MTSAISAVAYVPGVSYASAQVVPVSSSGASNPTKPQPKKPHALVKSTNDAASSDEERLTVRGQATSVQAALSEQKNGIGVSTILSRTQIERAPETNLADILTRLPGLSAYSNMSGGQAATGENQYVTIRGLDSSYNAYSLNGERIAPADPTTRAISFDMLAPYGISSVKVDKTVNADQDGDSIGGAIDIRIPTAFDFSHPFEKVSVQGQLNQEASDIGTSDLGGNAELELARRFGKDGAFGLYAAAYYEGKNVAADTVSPNASYAPTFSSQADLPLAGASSLSTSELKYDVFATRIKRYGGTLSLDYHGDHQTAYVQGTWGEYDKRQDDNQLSFIGSSPGYDTNGLYTSQTALRGQYAETDDSHQLLTTQKIGGTTDFGRLHLDYDIFNSYSVLSSPNQVEASLYPSGVVAGPFTFDTTGTVHPTVTGSPSALAALSNQDADRFWKTQGRDSQSTADMYGIHANATYRFANPILDFVKAGFKISETDRLSWEHPFFHDDNNFIYGGSFFGGQNYDYDQAVGPTVSQIPGRQVAAFGGSTGSLRLLNRNWIASQIVPYKYANDPGGAGNYTSNDWNANTSTGAEKVYAGYMMLGLHVGPVHIYPGFRYEWTDFTGTHWQSNGDDATGRFIGIAQRYGEPLPALNIDWRPTSMSVLRFSARRSFSRPAFGLVNGATEIGTDPITNQILSVSQPNPNLKPTTATDLDFSAELYNHHSGVVSANLYYKKLSKFIFTSISGTSNSATLGGNVPTGSYVSNGTMFSMPQNGGDATIEGMELNTEQQLYFLPSVLNGLGIEGNVTLQHSNARSGIADHPDTALPRAPEFMYNVGVFYARGGFRADLNYTYTATQLLSLNSSLPDFYLQPTKRLDLSMHYTMPHGITASFSVQNLLDTPAFWETEGKGSSYLAYDSSANGAYVQAGRTFLVGLGAEF